MDPRHSKKLSKVTEEASSSVVAFLGERKASHPFSCLAMSPNRQHACLAGGGELCLVSVAAQGIRNMRTLKIAQVCKKQETDNGSL